MAYNPYYNPYIQQGMYNGGAMPDVLNQMKGQYQQPMPQQTMPVQHTQPSSDMIWVQGESGAKAYLVAPNNTVTLWDSENPTIYIKSADASGVPTMRILDFKERTVNGSNLPYSAPLRQGEEFAPLSALTVLEAKFDELSAVVDTLKPKMTKTATKPKGENDNG